MTNERAIELLNRISDSQFDGEHGDERREALSMAVRALEQNLVKESGGLVKDLVNDCISRKMAIGAIEEMQMPIMRSKWESDQFKFSALAEVREMISELPSAQPERLTDDDFEAIRIHLNAYKEKLCNQHRWKEAEEYQRIIDRFMAFASAQPETHDKRTETHECDLIGRQEAIDIVRNRVKRFTTACVLAVTEIEKLPSAQLDSQEIGYWECSNAILKMWIDNVLTDGEYYRIADKLNTYWKDKIRGKNGE